MWASAACSAPGRLFEERGTQTLIHQQEGGTTGSLRERAGRRLRLQAQSVLARYIARPPDQREPYQHRGFWTRHPWRLALLVVVLALLVPGLLGQAGGHRTPPTPAITQQASQGGVAPGQSFGAGGPQAATASADDCGITNIGACLTDFINGFLSSIAQWWQTQVDNVTALGFIFSTPASVTYNALIVSQIETYSLSVVGAFLALTFAIAGYNYMTERSVTWTEILPQIFFCGMMAWAIMPIMTFAIDLANDFIGGLQGVNLHNVMTGNTDTSTMGIIAFIFELILDMGLALESLARLALLDLLIAIAPIGIFCFALPQSRSWGRLWAEAFVATLLIQPLQAVVVLIGSNLMATAVELFGPNFPPIVQILLGMACVYLAIRIPSMLSRVTHMAGDLRGQVTRVVQALATAA
jgi:hypothetical protein